MFRPLSLLSEREHFLPCYCDSLFLEIGDSLSFIVTFGPSAFRPTIPSADFSIAFPTPLDAGSTLRQQWRPPRAMRTYLHVYDSIASYGVLVHRSNGLPAASFRLRLTADALAIRLALPLTGRAVGLTPKQVRPAGRTIKSGASRKARPALQNA